MSESEEDLRDLLGNHRRAGLNPAAVGRDLTEKSSTAHKHRWVIRRCCYLGFDVFSGQTLSDDVDALTVTQDVGSALGVVHQRFDAADQRRVNLRLRALVVHRLQKIQDARQAVQVDESCDKPTNTQQTGESTCEPFRKGYSSQP